MSETKRTAAIILGPGGYQGAWQVGALLRLVRWLLEREIEVTLISGTSVGAVNGSLLAQASRQEDLLPLSRHLAEVWRLVETYGSGVIFPLTTGTVLASLVGALFGRRSVFVGEKAERIRKLLSGEFLGNKGMDWHAVVSSPIEFHVGVKNVTRNTLRTVVTNRDKDIVSRPLLLGEFVNASASVSPFYPLVEIEGEEFGDPGIVHVRQAIERNVSLAFVLLPYCTTRPSSPPSGFPGSWVFRGNDDLGLMIEWANGKILHHWADFIDLAGQNGTTKIVPVSMSAYRRSATGHHFAPGDWHWARSLGWRDMGRALTPLS